MSSVTIGCLVAALMFGPVACTLGQGNALDDVFGPSKETHARPPEFCTVRSPKNAVPENWLLFARRNLTACERACLSDCATVLLSPYSDTSDRASAAHWLGTLGHVDAREALWSVASNRFDHVHPRVESIEALARIPHDDTTHRLIQLLDDPRVATDCLRGLLLLHGNVLDLDFTEVKSLVQLYRLVEHLGGGAPIGGYRAVKGPHSGGYGSYYPPDVAALLERNEIPKALITHCDTLKRRYTTWWASAKDLAPRYEKAFVYGLLHDGGDGDAFRHVLDDTLEIPDSVTAKVPRTMLDEKRSRDEDFRGRKWNQGQLATAIERQTVFRAEVDYIRRVLAGLAEMPAIDNAQQGLNVGSQGDSTTTLRNPLASVAERIDAAKAINEQEGQAGIGALIAVALHQFDDPRVRAACVRKIAALAVPNSDDILLACVADPYVAAAAVDCLKGARETIRAQHEEVVGPPVEKQLAYEFAVPEFTSLVDRGTYTYVKSTVWAHRLLMASGKFTEKPFPSRTEFRSDQGR